MDNVKSPSAALWFTGGNKGISVEVQVFRSREAYGRIDWLCRPIGRGSGESWISRDSLTPLVEPTWLIRDQDKSVCGSCGWTITSPEAYRHRSSLETHCLSCHPLDMDWDGFGDSEVSP